LTTLLVLLEDISLWLIDKFSGLENSFGWDQKSCCEPCTSISYFEYCAYYLNDNCGLICGYSHWSKCPTRFLRESLNSHEEVPIQYHFQKLGFWKSFLKNFHFESNCITNFMSNNCQKNKDFEVEKHVSYKKKLIR